MMWWWGGMRMPSGRNDDPLDILRGRLARGEIDKEEFEDRKRLLTHP
jgi:uncharacterized membrane protein